MYINDICKVSKIFKFILFADDTNIFCCDSDLHKLLRVINAELEKIHMWFSANRLSLNVAKTNYRIRRNYRTVRLRNYGPKKTPQLPNPPGP